MTALVILGLALALGAIVGSFASYAIAHGREVVASVFRLDARAEWPRGVQEDDPPPTWQFPEGWGTRH